VSHKKQHSLRTDPICLNCGSEVKDRFCGHCGQENIEPRQSFAHLLAHFFEDLTHYEGKFWGSIKFLLFKPGYLTRQFLEGKRNKYVLPVRLYIFISFVTFLLPHLLPDFSKPEQRIVSAADTIKENGGLFLNFDGLNFDIYVPNVYKTIEEFEAAEMARPPHKRLGEWEFWLEKKYISLNKYSPHELGVEFRKILGRNIPKALFLYMPLFAFVIWLFSNKKKSWYFDHGIFTLHYFSFVLLVYNLHTITSSISSGMTVDNASMVWVINTCFLMIVYPVYFFSARKNAYGLNRFKNYLVSFLIINVNLLFFLLGLALLMIISLLSIS
jgi:hypothetical protein